MKEESEKTRQKKPDQALGSVEEERRKGNGGPEGERAAIYHPGYETRDETRALPSWMTIMMFDVTGGASYQTHPNYGHSTTDDTRVNYLCHH